MQVAGRYDGPLVVQKGKYDSISDGQRTIVCRQEGSPRRAGGQVRPLTLVLNPRTKPEP